MLPQRARTFVATVVAGFSPPLMLAAQAAEPPWEARFFEAPPAAVAAAAKLVPAPRDQPVVILFEERIATFDDQGKLHTRFRQAYKVTSPAGVTEWAEVGVAWRSWIETRPKLRARVIDAAGRAHRLDPATIEESGARSKDPTLYSDERLLRAPLPALGVGAVVETEIEIDSAPLLADGGHSHRWRWGGVVPVQKSRLVIQHPASLALRLMQRPQKTVLPVMSQRDGTRLLVFEGGPYEASAMPEPNQPPELIWRPFVAYGTAASWGDLAQRYYALVERRLAAADLRGLAREAAGAERDPIAILRRLMARVHKDVRYTGVELGASAIEPTPPGEVLKRGYGDCKDKATLLVGLLRALGIKAHVALLRAGVALDVDPEVPSLALFNHAIVFVPGKRPLFVDPTAAYAPVGELPISDQGRLALIIAPDTAGLTPTPRDGVAGSRTRETRTIHLGEVGAPRVIERFEPLGAAARDLRGHYAEHERKELQEQIDRYVKAAYDAKTLTRFDFGDPRDVGRPFWLEIEAADAGIGSTEDGIARVSLRSSGALERLPADLRPNATEDKSGAYRRKTDFELYEPHSYELRYRVIPPHGFVSDPLPPARAEAWGPIKLTSRFRQGDDGAVEAVFEVTAERRRLNPTEYEAVRAGIGKFLTGEAPQLTFRPAGDAALAAGKVQEAIALFRRLDADHPGQALHALQLARALLGAGLGEAARKQAREATERDPRSTEALRVLGEVLERDLVGRPRGASSDPAGAEAAYRKALTLDARDGQAKVALAQLLGGDDEEAPATPVQLAESERLWRDLVTGGREDLRGQWLVALLRLGRWAELIDRGTGVPLPSFGQACVLAAFAMGPGGAAAAIREATVRIAEPADRREALRIAATEVMNRRRYGEATLLFGEAARGHENATQMRRLADLLRRARPFEERPVDPKDPVAVARRALLLNFAASAAPGTLRSRMAPLVTPELLAEFDENAATRALRRGLQALGAGAADIRSIVFVDLMGDLPGHAEGDERTGFRAIFSPPQGGRMALLVAARPDGPRVIAFEANALAALEAQRLGRAGDLAGARRWLEWIGLMRFGLTPGGPDAATVITGGPIADLAELEHEVALQVANGRAEGPASAPAPAPEVAAQLERCAAKARHPDRRRRCARTLIVRARLEKRPEEALARLDRLRATIVDGGEEELRDHVLIDLGRFVQERAPQLAKQPAGTPFQQREIAGRLMRGGDVASAEAIYRRLVTTEPPVAEDLNQLAWLRLLAGDASEATLNWARRAVEVSQRQRAAALHTLATTLAERGEVAEARDILLEAIQRRPEGDVIRDDHYILGRIAEACGTVEAALESYRRVLPPHLPSAADTSVLAQRRLRALSAATMAPPRSPAAAAPAR